MNKYYTIAIITTCIIASLCLRIIPPYDLIFTGDWIKYSSIDAYWQMAQVDKIAPDFWWSVTHITDIKFAELKLFHWILSAVVWLVGFGSPTQTTIDTVGAFFPAILGALTIIPVYFLGSRMFGKTAGIISAILIAILPGEWLARSSLGFTDHHVMEVLFSTTMIMFFVMAFKADGRRRIIYGLLSALFLGLYYITWAGGMLFIFIIIAFLWVYIMRHSIANVHSRKLIKPVYMFCGLSILTMVMLLLTNFSALSAILTGATPLTTMELRPLTLWAAWGNFTFGIFIIPMVMVVLLIYAMKTRHTSAILLIVWSLITLVAMLIAMRFAYYFAVNVALLTGWFIWWVRLPRINKRHTLSQMAAIIIFITSLVIPNVMIGIGTVSQAPYAPSDEWCETLSWVADNTPETVGWSIDEPEPSSNHIMAWWDSGYWINRMAHRKAYVNPGQQPVRIKELSLMLLSSTDVMPPGDYLILDDNTVNNKRMSISIWAGYTPDDYCDTLMVRLYNGENVDGWSLIYESKSQEVKVYKYE